MHHDHHWRRDRAVSAFLFGHGCSEKVVGLVARCLRIREAGGADQVGQDLQLIDQLLIELTPALIGRKKSLPDSLRGTAMAEALEAIADLDLTALTEVKPPRGYGRD
jgi:hypothetical protein